MSTNRPKRVAIHLAGIETAYLDVGQGEPIVALHGIPTSSLLFEPLLPHLSDYRVIAPDLLGQGRTETPPTGRLDYAAYAEHVRAFMDSVPPPDFHLLIHDLGGILGLDWAAGNPDRLRSLLVLSTTITTSFRVGRVLYAANLLFGKNLLRWAVQSTLKRKQRLDSYLFDEWVEPWSRRRVLRGMDHFSGGHLRRIRATLNRIRVPVLIVWGKQDSIFPMRHASHLAQAFPRAQMVTIPRCGHWSTLDAPDEVAGAINEFMKKNGLGW